MAKKILPIGLEEDQYNHVKKKSGNDSMAWYIRKLIQEDMKKRGK